MCDLVILVGKDVIFCCEVEFLFNELLLIWLIWKKNGVDLKIDGGCNFVLEWWFWDIIGL